MGDRISYWKRTGIALAVVFVLAMLIGNYIYIRKLQKINVDTQLNLIDMEFEKTDLIEKANQKEFNNKIYEYSTIVKQKEKEVYEIKESIKNPGINFNDTHIQDSINAEFHRRFIKD